MYNHKLFEIKWKEYWINNNIYEFQNNLNSPKFYILDMFPYPSGSGLHVGHPKGYIATDILARYKKMNGFDVLHPIGWDAFGLPAEQYAIQTNNHPESFTKENINHFRKQLQSLGFCFDYNKEVNTTDPKFYKWTQWIFSKLYEKGLAEIKEIEVNWCEKLNTVLANEEVLTNKNNEKVSERGGFPVIKKPMKQWVLKITDYADKLLDGLNEVNWPNHLVNIQKKWIGKSVGANIKFKIENNNDFIEIFTSKPCTIFGVSFIGLSYEHDLVKKILKNNKNKELSDVIEKIQNLKEFERTIDIENPLGIFLNEYVIHPFTNKKIPIYISSYVLSSYGNKAIMGVPWSDERDYFFAKKFNLPFIKITNLEKDFNNIDKLINSDFLSNLNEEDANKLVLEKLISLKIGSKAINYKLKDWIFSRQRYWGEPFPILFDEKGDIYLETNLPLLLPKLDSYKNTNGKSPLSNLSDWINVTKDNKKFTRETNTMPQWAGSCWYYLAYILKQKDGNYIDLDSKEAYDLFSKWLPVDIYVGGQEHAVLHLLYARFWHRFLYDINIVPTKEPFYKVINQGMILGPDNEKMSKSKGNVINPDDIVNDYGADTLRLYEMFMGPVTASLPWNEQGIFGMYKWLNRVYRLFEIKKISNNTNNLLDSKYMTFLSKINNQIENFEYNLVISEMMILVNEFYKYDEINLNILIGFIKVLSCFAPFVSEEIWVNFLNQKPGIFLSKWPTLDKNKIIIDEIKIPVQINGKLKDILEVKKSNLSEDEIFELVFNLPKIKIALEGKKILKRIYVKNKIINIIV